MRNTSLVEVTHSRRLYTGFGFLIVAAAVCLKTVVGLLGELSPPLTTAVNGWVIALVVFGVLFPLATPTTGSIDRTLTVYKLQLLALTGLPLVAMAPLLVEYPILAGVAAVPASLVYLALQIDWAEARRHLKHIRSAEDPADVQLLPQKALSHARHVLAGGGAVMVGTLLPGLFRPVRGSVVFLGLAIVVGGIAAMAATPHRGSTAKVVLAFKVGIIGPGACILLAGITRVVESGVDIVAGGLLLVGAGLLYLGLVQMSWKHVEEIIEELRAREEVTWGNIPDALERMNSKETH